MRGTRSLRAAILLSASTGALTAAAVVGWLPSALRGFDATFASSAAGFALACSWGGGLRFALAAAPVHLARGAAPGWRVAAAADGWMASDWIACHPALGLHVALLGHSQIGALGVAQLALVGGVPLISGLLAGVGQALALWAAKGWSRARAAPALALVGAWTALVACGLPVATGWRPERRGDVDPVDLLLVQPDLPRGERWAPRLQRAHLERAGRYTLRALRGSDALPDAVVWPENLVTSPVDTSPALGSELAGWAERFGTSLLLGVARSASARNSDTYRSSALWMRRDGTLGATLDKHRAVPVLEAAGWPGWLDAAFGAAADWSKVEEGEGGGALRADGATLTVVLCYEALFPDLVAARRVADSAAILNLADDSWVQGVAATEQLAAYARFRAIEQRLPLARVAHGGLSIVVDAFGRTLERLPLDAWAHATLRASPRPPPGSGERVAIALVPLAGAGVALGAWRLATRPHTREA
jgi:apolipoprotein N-acyltransferase